MLDDYHELIASDLHMAGEVCSQHLNCPVPAE